MKKTNKEVIVFTNTANAIIKSDELKTKPFEKLKYALKKVTKSLKPIIEDYQDDLEDLRIDYCSVDADGNIINDEKGNYKFSKENTKKLKKAGKELFEKEVEIKPHFVEIPKDVPEELVEVFSGFVFEPKQQLEAV